MRPTKLYRTTGGTKGTTVLFHTDAGKMTARKLLKYANITSRAQLLRRLRIYGENLSILLDGVPKQERVEQIVTSVCRSCGISFRHPFSQKSRKCCSNRCAAEYARMEDGMGNEEWRSYSGRPRTHNLAKIRTGSLEASV